MSHMMSGSGGAVIAGMGAGLAVVVLLAAGAWADPDGIGRRVAAGVTFRRGGDDRDSVFLAPGRDTTCLIRKEG